MVSLFGSSQGVVEGQHFYKATRNGTQTANAFEFWILISQYNNSLRELWERYANN